MTEYENLPSLTIADLPCLPWVEFAAYKTLPNLSGIYLAVTNTYEVLYIGATHNMRQRWAAHHRRISLHALGCTRIAWYPCEGSMMLSLEAKLIHQWQPPLNTRGTTATLQPTSPRILPENPDFPLGHFTFYCSTELWRQFKAACALQGVTASKMLVQLIQQFLEKEGQS